MTLSSGRITACRWVMAMIVISSLCSRSSSMIVGLGLGIERRAGLVEEQELRIGIERAGDRDALPLAARKLQAALADLGLVAVRQALDEAADRGPLGGPLQPLLVVGRGRARCWSPACRSSA